MNLWGLPERVVEAVLFHHSVDDLDLNKYNLGVLPIIRSYSFEGSFEKN